MLQSDNVLPGVRDWITVDGPNSAGIERREKMLVTTLDGDLQDVATTALLNQLRKTMLIMVGPSLWKWQQAMLKLL